MFNITTVSNSSVSQYFGTTPWPTLIDALNAANNPDNYIIKLSFNTADERFSYRVKNIHDQWEDQLEKKLCELSHFYHTEWQNLKGMQSLYNQHIIFFIEQEDYISKIKEIKLKDIDTNIKKKVIQLMKIQSIIACYTSGELIYKFITLC